MNVKRNRDNVDGVRAAHAAWPLVGAIRGTCERPGARWAPREPRSCCSVNLVDVLTFWVIRVLG